MRFPDKTRHLLFLEPCGLDTEEMYLQGMSSSLPESVQIAFLRTIEGLEHVEIMRTAYAIEYDCVDPLALKASLEFLDFDGLFGAGQFNGSSGYEEAAAQGLIAGINAARKVQGKPAFVLDRASSYIGTLIDDLVTKGTDEPYRMMTSRAEFRLSLRQDNADLRLTELGRACSLVSDKRYKVYCKRKREREDTLKFLDSRADGKIAEEIVLSRNEPAPKSGLSFSDLLRRGVSIFELREKFGILKDTPNDILTSAQTEIAYEGYLKANAKEMEKAKRMEERPLPEDIDYQSIQGLRLEAREKLSRIRPLNLGQAERISGVSPADITVLMIYMSLRK